jgi:hypothetical protein
LTRPGVQVIDGQPVGSFFVPEVDVPSRFRVHVYVMPEDTLADLIKGNHDIRSAPQEAVCENDKRFTVTEGIYLSPSELAHQNFLVQWITKDLNLERPIPLGPPDGLQPR